MCADELQLRAGGDDEDPPNVPNTESAHKQTPGTPSDIAGAHDSEDESVVHVDAVLQSRLKIEFDETVARFHKQKEKNKARPSENRNGHVVCVQATPLVERQPKEST